MTACHGERIGVGLTNWPDELPGQKGNVVLSVLFGLAIVLIASVIAAFQPDRGVRFWIVGIALWLCLPIGFLVDLVIGFQAMQRPFGFCYGL